MRRRFIIEHLEIALQTSLESPRLRVVQLIGERPAIDEIREPWVPIKYGPAHPDDWFGVVPVIAHFTRSPSAAIEHLPLIVKVSPRYGLARTLIPWIIKNQNINLDRPYIDYRRSAESDRTGERERQIYRIAASRPELHQILPRFYGEAEDPDTGECAIFLETIVNPARLDATGDLADWPPDAIDAALGAAARWQGVFWDIRPADADWAGPRPLTADMIADESLWRALLDDGRKRFPNEITEQVWRRRHGFIDTLSDWHSGKDKLPATLAHNDYNQRNIGFRPSVVVLDWELVELNSAHRDIVELLTFVLPPAADRSQVDSHIELHRQRLIGYGVASGVDRDEWREGFRAELRVESIDRIGLQLLFASRFSLAYLARINRNIERLLDMYE